MIIGNNIQQPRNNGFCKLNLRGQAVTDSSPSGKTVTNNNATLNTTTYKYNGSSYYFNGTNAYLSLADSVDWHFGGDDFTIDLWINYQTTPDNDYLFAQDTNIDNRLLIHNDSGIFKLRWVDGGVWTEAVAESGQSITTNTWYHIAFVRNENEFSIYRNGTQTATNTETGFIPNFSNVLAIASRIGSKFTNAYIDELHIYKGIALYTRNFTPPNRSA
jgi:hypothetical protein